MSNAFVELIEKARNGDQEAVRLLREEYGAAIEREVRFALYDNRLKRLVGESDICQSVFMRFCMGLWAGQFELESPEQLVALLRTMVRTRVIDWARYARAGRRDVRRTETLDSGQHEKANAALPTPSEIVSHQELLERFKAQLSPQNLQILEMRHSKMSWQQICDELREGTPESLRKQHERAIQRALDAADCGSLGG